MKTFVINLDSSQDRLNRISVQLKKLGVPFERVPAVNGTKLTDDFIKNITYPLDHIDTKTRFTRALTRGEIGCFLSHRVCWELLLESNEKWALILEDDIEISPYAAKYLSDDKWLPSDVNLCQLNAPYDGKIGRIGHSTKNIDKDIKLVQPLYPTPTGSFAYFISRDVALEALRSSKKLPSPVDNFLFSPWFDISPKFVLWRTDPSLVIPLQDVKSDVGDRGKNSIKKAPFLIRHGLKRLIMDWKIRRYQSKGKEFVFKFWK